VGELALSRETYVMEPPAPLARLDVSASPSGRLLRLRFDGELVGPCWRCLEPARVAVHVDAREFQASGRPPGAPHDDDLDSTYLDGSELDLVGWARDAVVEGLPPAIHCAEECAGLCPTCGAALAAGPCGCPPPPADSRWAALGPLAERLRREEG
jgi:uncharacterized protein